MLFGFLFFLSTLAYFFFLVFVYFFFFKQKTAYEMRISDWSSDVCSSDLDRNLRTQPTEFDIVFLAEVGDGTSAIFNYQLSYNADRICEERLFSRTTKPRARDRELFTRKWNSESGQYDFTFGPSALGSKELWMSEANETLPLLTEIGREHV